jgi:Ni,Fe-hydrogenase III large subunit
MDEEKYEEQFRALTGVMEYEKMLDRLAERAELARIIARHSVEVYKAGRAAGLPRATAGQMAISYFQFEITPSSVYVIGGEE